MKLLKKIFRLLRTVKYLSKRQIFYRIKYFLFKGHISWRPVLTFTDFSNKTEFIYDKNNFGYCSNNKFEFLNKNNTIIDFNWNDISFGKLWLYNLHYQQWLFAKDCDAEYWINKWIDDNPAYNGNGWEPYPLSLRIISWIKIFSTKNYSPSKKVINSISVQISALYSKLEFHIDANHLLENLFALYLSLSFLNDNTSKTLVVSNRIKKLFFKELDIQFLNDGGHYELSPMYHAIMLERILDILNILKDKISLDEYKKLENIASKGLDWLYNLSYNGQYYLLNDSSYNGSRSALELFNYGNEIIDWKKPHNLEVVNYLKDSGYIRIRKEQIDMIIDVGAVGPDHQLGHSHCDMLSYCLNINGVEIIGDSGNSEYVIGDNRKYCRSTSAHNTFQIKDVEQAEIWASHRIGHRGYPKDTEISDKDSVVKIKGGATCYSWLKDNPNIERKFIIKNNYIEIFDEILCKKSYNGYSYINLLPDSKIIESDEGVAIELENIKILIKSQFKYDILQKTYCPEFGKILKKQVIRFKFKHKMSYIIQL